jgi:outer membrane protein assembly factor BamB
MRIAFLRRSALGPLALVAVVGSVAITGCGGSSKTTTTKSTSTPSSTASSTTAPPSTTTTTSSSSASASGWTLPNGNLQNTRDVASTINASNVSKLGVAWTVPIKATGADGGYATTPVVVDGVVYTEDLDSNVEAINLATGKVLWNHLYNSPNEGPDGVTVANGTVFAATATSAVALQAATGEQLWSKKLIRNDHEGIDMAPGYYNGTVYVSTVPGNAKTFYAGNGEATLWALNASSGAPEWKWDEVGDLWSKGNKKLQDINSGGGQWQPPSFDSQGNIYLGVANPAPLMGTAQYPWGTSRPGPNLYTDSVVKLSPQGKLMWYYQLTPHDLYDWDINNTPILTNANGTPVAIDGGKGGILFEVNAQTGKLLWKLPVGVHNGHTNDGLITENMTPQQARSSKLGNQQTIEPWLEGGIETQPASNGTTAFAAVQNGMLTVPSIGVALSGPASKGFFAKFAAGQAKATGDMVAVDQDTGKVKWDDKLSSPPFGAATVTNNVVFTTTYSGHLYAFNANTGAVLLNKPMSAGTNATVAVDGDYLITAASYPQSKTQQPLIIAYKLGANGSLPDTVP